MAQLDRALLLPETRASTLNDWELRQSIRTIGLQNPILWHNGSVLDGSRRLHVCRVLRIPPRQVHVNDRIEAARMLWREHPARAWRTFYVRGMRPVQAAHLFGCSLSEIPAAEKIRNVLTPYKHVTGSEQAALPRIIVSRAELAAAHAACRARGTTLSAAIKELVRAMGRAQNGQSDSGGS